METVWTEERMHLGRREAARWIGTPHRDRLARIGVGIDCINYVYAILIAAGVVEWKEIGGYNTSVGFKETTHRMKNAFKACVQCVEIQPTEPVQFGDVIVFKEGRFAAHGGFYADGKIWHALARRTVTANVFGEWLPLVDCFLRITAIGLIGEPSLEKNA